MPDSRTLEHQGGDRDLPAAILFADQVGLGNLYILEKNLVEAARAGHLHQRPDRDARAVHVDQQIADALVLGGGGVGADQQENVGVTRVEVQIFLPLTTK